MADEDDLPLPLPLVTGQESPSMSANPMIPGAMPPAADSGQQSGGVDELLDTLTGADAAPVSETERIRGEINELIGGGTGELLLGPLKQSVRFDAPPPPPPGQGFRFDPEGATKIINEINDILKDDIEACERMAVLLRRIDPPGAEHVSERAVKIANLSGEAYVTYLDSLRARLEWFKKQVKDARDQKLSDETDAAEGYNKA